MTFDDELNTTFGTFIERLQTDIARQVQGVIAELRAHAQSDRERVSAEARAVATQEAHRERDDAVRAAVSAADRRAADAVAEVEARLSAAAIAGEARERAAVAETEARGQVALAEAEAREHAAVAAAEARAVAAVAAADLRLRVEPVVPSFDRTPTDRLRDAVDAFTHAHTLTDTLAVLMARAAIEAPRVAVLLVQGGRLRVWRLAGFPAEGGHDADHGSWSGAEEAWRTGTSVATGGAAQASGVAALREGSESVAVPIILCGEVVAVLYADHGSAGRPAQPPSPAWVDTIELLARHAALSLEALTAFKTARALLAGPAAAVSAGAASVASDEDAAARRYARLLVSEIKLYHEAAVVAGRRDRDLMARLGGEIARARVLYDQRVPTTVRQRTDPFEDELVRTLANGDASLLDAGS